MICILRRELLDIEISVSVFLEKCHSMSTEFTRVQRLRLTFASLSDFVVNV